jgi:23S rRNA (adenine2030-N6)-methyltransferase
MNYRHAFHAGNFADCMKHALGVWLLRALQRKETPIFVLDTHAGAGSYDLTRGPAERTSEWRGGIGRLLVRPPTPLQDYLDVVRKAADTARPGPNERTAAEASPLPLYPGSPLLLRALLRDGDRMACCELHPDEYAALRRRFARDPAVAIHHRDAWEAIRALLPPKERRGLVLIDPPYESLTEFADLAGGLHDGWSRFPTGVFAAWYPIKHRAPVRAFHDALRASGMRDIVAAELCLRAPLDPNRLNGCGLLVINSPFRFESDVPPLLAALRERLGDRETGEGSELIRLVDE